MGGIKIQLHNSLSKPRARAGLDWFSGSGYRARVRWLAFGVTVRTLGHPGTGGSYPGERDSAA